MQWETTHGVGAYNLLKTSVLFPMPKQMKDSII